MNYITEKVKEQYLSLEIMKMKEQMEMIEKVNEDIINYIHSKCGIRDIGVYNLDLLLDYYKHTNEELQEQFVLWLNEFGLKYFELYHPFQKDLINKFIETIEDLDSDWELNEEDINQLYEDYWLDREEDEREENDMEID